MEEGRYITVALAGRSGAGKSTLFKNLVSEDLDTSCGSAVDIKKDGNTFRFIDTTSQEELKEGFDVLVYCMPVCPGFKFQDGNPEEMQFLQNAYGADIWKHCVIVFTFGNLAWDHIHSRSNDLERTNATFRDYLEQYLELFRTELETKLNVRMNIKAILSLEAGGSIQPLDQHMILAIPAGVTPQDQLLAGVTPHSEGWTDKIFHAIHTKNNCVISKIVPLPSRTATIRRVGCMALFAIGIALSYTFAGESSKYFLVTGLAIMASAWWIADHSM